jgi:hypothetical protein
MRTSRTIFGVFLVIALATGGCGSMLRDMMGPTPAPTAVTVRCVQEDEAVEPPAPPAPPAPTPRVRTR